MSYLYRIVFFCCFIACLFSCQAIYNHRLGAGLHAHDLIYQPKPLASRDSGVNTATYLGGVTLWGKGYHEGFKNGQSQDRHWLGLLQVSRAHSWNAATISYGAFGYLGQYYIGNSSFSEYPKDSLGNIINKPLPSIYRGNYGFYGFGFRGSAQLNAILGRNTNWRFLGVEMAYSREYGELTRIRQRIPRKTVNNGLGREYSGHSTGYDRWIVARQPALFTIAATTEMVFNSDPAKDRSFSMKYSIGTSSAPYGTSRWFTISQLVAAYQYYQHNVSVTLGYFNSKPNTHLSYHYRLGYKQKKKANRY
ncbi:hypothetical protein [Siphonobacter curvatus]|uniref:DUF2490 domain-containing protein n=1 Tax=Siphonobacter curvatus TaxID=2094562 RepID=A0A2S7IF96_9BACT|nr:hypothetical protein [Siphonobacter curvatus]PQA53698.1 hypothetical protein C5O19_23740 [Siphonobacter curvatus]